MARDNTSILVELYMTVSGSMIKSVAKVFTLKQTRKHMKVLMQMESEMDMAYIDTRVVMSMMVLGKTITDMVKLGTLKRMERSR